MSIQDEIDAVESKMAHCYCAMCRKFHGAALSTFAEVKTDNYSSLKDKDSLVDYMASNGTGRQFVVFVVLA